MRLGPSVRSMFGRYERRFTELFRSFYINIDAFVELVMQWKPNAAAVLEVGCGEGAVTQHLSATYPQAQITAIDITPRVGRLYTGAASAVRFARCTAQEIAAAEPGHYDLVVLSDVLHHVPPQFRQGILHAIRMALAPGGTLVFKEWQKNRSLIHLLCYASDRFVTGDQVSYMTREEMRAMLSITFGAGSLVAESRVGPRWNNLAIAVHAS